MLHKETRIYQRSLELIDLTKRILDSLPRGYGFLADQLRRASGSVTLNFAEGCGQRTPAMRRKHFTIARGSVLEVTAAVDVAQRFGVVDDRAQAEVRDLCDHISAMLYRFR